MSARPDRASPELGRRVLVVLGALLAPVLAGAGTGGGGTGVGGSGAATPTLPGDTGTASDSGACVDSAVPDEVCLPWNPEVQGDCPASVTADFDCWARLGRPTYADGQCCWPVETYDPVSSKGYGCGCAHGRPLLDAPLPRAVARRRDWLDPRVVPDLGGLDAPGRATLAAFWASVAANEHASVAAFHRAALELGRVGGPDRLVAALERAAADERRHARGAFALASAFAGEPLGPAPAAPGPLAVGADLAEVAARTVREGCGEEARSLAAAVAMREVARDPAVVRFLDGLVRDEARHVRLAFRIARWAARAGGPEVAAAVARASLLPLPRLDGDGDLDEPALAAWGRLGDGALAEVVGAADAALLGPARAALAA